MTSSSKIIQISKGLLYGERNNWPNLRYYPSIWLERAEENNEECQDNQSPG
jgi:hypothetical protein